MAVSQPRYSKEEFARRGDEIYERDLRPHVEAGNEGKFIVIDIDTGAYEIDADHALSLRALLRVVAPDRPITEALLPLLPRLPELRAQLTSPSPSPT